MLAKILLFPSEMKKPTKEIAGVVNSFLILESKDTVLKRKPSGLM